jgi:hypothetical protein
MILSLILGILGSLVASILFLIFASYFRPNLTISSNISVSEYNGEKIYSLKVINLGPRIAVNIRSELQIIGTRVVEGGKGRMIFDVPLLKNDLLILNPYQNAESVNFSFEFSTKEDLEEEWKKIPESTLCFRLNAQDSLTSFFKVFEKEYFSQNESIQTGRFAYGKSMEIHS